MARKRAGGRYPYITTDARPHNHRMCPVVRVIAERVAAAAEPWGTRWEMPPVPSETIARAAKQAFYSARYCRELAAVIGEPISIQSDFDRIAADDYRVWVKVWPRSAAMAEIVRRVKANEPLAYNAAKGA